MVSVKEDSDSADMPSLGTFSLVRLIGLQTSYLTKGLKKPTPHSTSKPPTKSAPAPTAPRTFGESEMDVLCVNCMKMIPSSLVAEHSLHCVQVNSEVKLMEQCPQTQLVDYKIRRLKEALGRLTNDSGLIAHKPNNAYYLKVLSEYADDLVGIMDYTQTDIVRCNEVILNLTTLSKGFTGSPCIRIYVERLSVLAKEKHVQLVNYYKEIAASNPLPAITKKTEELLREKQIKAEQLRRSKNSVKEMRGSIESRTGGTYRATYINRPNQVNDDIRSDAGRDELLSRQSKLSNTSYASIGMDRLAEVEAEIEEEERKRTMNENLKRYFFTLVARNKKVLGAKHLGYYVNTNQMFSFVIQKAVPVADWPKFVGEEMAQRPEQWKDDKQLKKVNELLKKMANRRPQIAGYGL